MPASPVCRDTLVLATVGAALNLVNLEAIKNLFPATGAIGRVGVILLTIPACSDIEHPLLFSGKSNNILMRELFPQSKQKASPFVNTLKVLQNREFPKWMVTIFAINFLAGEFFLRVAYTPELLMDE